MKESTLSFPSSGNFARSHESGAASIGAKWPPGDDDREGKKEREGEKRVVVSVLVHIVHKEGERERERERSAILFPIELQCN